jgi:hypothetical protein
MAPSKVKHLHFVALLRMTANYISGIDAATIHARAARSRPLSGQLVQGICTEVRGVVAFAELL